MKLAICNETYGDWEFERVCADVARSGYDGVEVALGAIDDDPRRIDDRRAAELGRVAERAGLAVVGLHWLLAKPAGMHLTTADAAVRRRTVEYLCHLARLCARMGGSVLVLGSPQQRSIVGDRAATFARARDACRTVAEHAGPLGVTLALEPIAPAYADFLTTAAEARELMDAVDHPACRLHLDVCAMSAETKPVPEVIRENAGLFAHFHANDPNLRGPGTGEVDFDVVAEALRDAGYDGWVSVEVFDYTPDGPTIARESMECLRRAFT